MWVFLNNSFLSIVQKPGQTDTLTVRGRIRGDIERVFPDATVVENAGTDYKFRAVVKRADVAKAMSESVMNLTASNFKGSVKDPDRHDAYYRVWEVMNDYQYESATARKRGRNQGFAF